eukprot:TRINITY_DN30584_c0_g1_i4.p1 TRINITY_DN30584_c0_g1~~TRINITY_DN30584_c0_g1_i4.p1  ORF type:complete len:848 (+),score=141.52 TRINITY_DN30584_c0_g1_i4:74-2545(+)
MVAADRTGDVDTWNWMQLLMGMIGGGSCSVQVAKHRSQSRDEEQKTAIAAVKVCNGGDCGPDAAAWLLNEHGPVLYRSRAPETRGSVRRALQQAWRNYLGTDFNGDEHRVFVLQRLEQVPEAIAEDELDVQVALILQAVLRCEIEDASSASSSFGSSSGAVGSPEGDANVCGGGSGDAAAVGSASSSRPLPYWFLLSDWGRLSEAYQVDFVVHGLPGAETRRCDYCGCSGHVHLGPRAPGIDLCLHVAWRDAVPTGGANPNEGSSSDAWGHWEPLGSGPISAKQADGMSLAGSASSLLRRNGLPIEVWNEPARSSDDVGVPVESVENTMLESQLWGVAGLSCPRGWPVSSSVCQPVASCQDMGCQRGDGVLCRKTGGCHFCAATSVQRYNEEDNPLVGGTLNSNVSTAVIPPSAHLPRAGGAVAGARFSVLLEGAALNFGGSTRGGALSARGIGSSSTSSAGMTVSSAVSPVGGIDGGGTPLDGCCGVGGSAHVAAAEAAASDGGTGGTADGRGHGLPTISSGAARRICCEGSSGCFVGNKAAEDEELARFREAFAAGIAETAAITPSRVRVLDVGPPLDAGLTLEWRRRRHRGGGSGGNGTNSTPPSTGRLNGGGSCGTGRPLPTHKSNGSTPTHGAPRSAVPPVQTPFKDTSVDTGAGVLAFLDREETDDRMDELAASMPEAAAELSDCAVACSSGGDTSATSAASVAAEPGDITRILFVIREIDVTAAVPASAAGSLAARVPTTPEDEPCAMRALEQVIGALAKPDSALQRALRPWTDGREARLWCPEVASGERGPRPSAWLARRQLHGPFALGSLAKVH